MEANRPMLDLVSAMTSAMKAQDRLLSFFDEAGLRLKLELPMDADDSIHCASQQLTRDLPAKSHLCHSWDELKFIFANGEVHG